MCECVCERKIETVCECVSMCVFVSVCLRDRERVRAGACVRETEKVTGLELGLGLVGEGDRLHMHGLARVEFSHYEYLG